MSSVGNIVCTLFSAYSDYCSVEISSYLHGLLEQEESYRSDELQSDIQHVMSNPCGASYQAMKTLKIDPEITLLEHYLDLKQKNYPR